MATFKTHTEGGSWTGGGTEVPNCNTAQQAVLNTAMLRIARVLGGWNLPCLIAVRDRLQDRLNCSLVIDCPGCTNLDGFTDSIGSANVSLCNTALGGTQARATAVLFHEMVHSVGGTELDAEALENHFFGGNGATFPTSDDFPKFRGEGGAFVIWDEATGNVFERCVEGGSWNSSPTITQGAQLNVNFPAPPSTGGGGGSWI
ncbi:hypothetical protein OV208_40210 [Corallococcus sp. bb12-1]|uniref:hypothetical protein n=1 Tax=Corallococcus sp. bb12-1 TaxID=2996784 RepID=UPI0022719842|nr:hypothetical protein [Corallococcus sp. bb12-1]MCY1047592.1 hypothetical protein [Corallococcus sp. bb12-1]